MKMTTENLKRLIDKFMDGGTTLEEEQLLYDYFGSGNVADELKEYSDYFTAFGLLTDDSEEIETEPVSKKVSTAKVVALNRRKQIVRWVAVAAAVVIAFIATNISIYKSQNYCEAYVYGKKTTNKAVVMQEMKSTLHEIDADNQPSVDEQLKDVLM